MNGRPWGRLFAPFLAVVGLSLVAWGLERVPSLAVARAAAGREAVPAGAIGSKKVRAGLHRAGVLHLQPPRDLLALAAPDSRGDCPPPAIGPHPVAPEDLPSTRLLPDAWRARRDLPVLSLYLEPCRLQRLLASPRGRGRVWEEPGWLTLWDGGEAVFASPVGVRLHGDKTRLLPGPKSFRVYFRAALGGRPFPGERLSPRLAGHGLDELILHNDARLDVPDPTLEHRFVNPVSNDIARRTGLEVPETRPVVMIVNGELTGPVYVLTERLGVDWAERRFGHRDFDVLRGRARLDDEQTAKLEELRRLVLGTSADRFGVVAAETFDLESVGNWYVVVQLCATDDQLQAAWVRDRRGRVAEGRWFVVPWDLDLGFRKRRRHGAPAWQKNNFEFFHERPPGRRDVLQILVHRLVASDPEARRRLVARFDELLSGDLAPEWIAGRLAHYAEFARRVPVDDLRFVAAHEEFFRQRPDELRRQVAKHLGEAAETPEASFPSPIPRVP